MSEEKHRLQRQADRARPGKSRSVMSYLVIMFAAAFVLLLLSYFMQQRNNEDIDGLKQSVSAIQSAQEVYEENTTLREQLNQLEDQLEEKTAALEEQITDLENQVSGLKQENTLLQEQANRLELSTQALDWFWQINEAYVRGRYTRARELIEQMGTELPQYLPTESVTNNGRFSPYERYQEIAEALS